MAKAKKSSGDSKKFQNDEVSQAMYAKYGESIRTGTEVLNNISDLKVLSVSPALDLELGGGFREGSVVIITADPKVGKTTTALHFAAKCQKLGKKVIYCNTEGRLAKHNFTGVKDLDAESIVVVESTDDKILSAEEYLTIIEYYINNDPGCIIIVDSTSNMIPQSELEGEISSKIRASLPKLLAHFCKRVSGTIMKNRVICILITHNIANASGIGRRTKWSDCGNMIQYQAGTNINATHASDWTDGEKGPQIGQTIHWEVITSAAGGFPGSKAASWLKYGLGIDENQELVTAASEFGLIKANGAWYTLVSLINNIEHESVKKYIKDNEIDTSKEENIERAFKFQGAAKVNKFLEENPALTDIIYSDLKEILTA
jgi:recombination protein RecA